MTHRPHHVRKMHPRLLRFPIVLLFLSVRPRILTQIQAQKEHEKCHEPHANARRQARTRKRRCHEEESSVRFDDVWVKL